MTEVLEEFPTSHRGRPAKYPWDEWADDLAAASTEEGRDDG